MTKDHSVLLENHHLQLDEVIFSQVHCGFTVTNSNYTWFNFPKFEELGFGVVLATLSDSGHIICHLGLPLH